MFDINIFIVGLTYSMHRHDQMTVLLENKNISDFGDFIIKSRKLFRKEFNNTFRNPKQKLSKREELTYHNIDVESYFIGNILIYLL